MSGLDTSSGRTRVRLELLAEVRSVLADEDGACILAFQARMGSARCATFTGAVLGNRLAVQVSTGNAWHVGAVLVDLSTPAAYRAFDLDPVPPGANAAMVLSETRLAWQFVPNDRLISVALDGTDQRIFAGFTPDVGGLAVPVSTGSHFLFDRVVDSTAPPTADIGISDGTAEQQPLLGGPDAARAGIAYANGRIAWQVGRDRRAVEGYSFGRVELWTSPFSPRASELSPRQVATLDGYHGFSKSVAGAGRYVTFKPSADPNAFHEADVWDLETGARETLRVTGELRTLLGVSPGHVWLHTMNPEQLLRFAIP